MASTIIHLAIAKKVLEHTKTENIKDYYLGSIAPDISRQIGQSKEKSHFQINTANKVPNIKLFVKRYPYFKYNSFDLGYFIHLYTDKLWIENLYSNFIFKNSIKLLDGTILETDYEEISSLLYSDYTNLNIKLIEEYNLDLSLFYEPFLIPKTNMKEIPVENLDILINKMGILIENSTSDKTYIIDLEPVKDFINKAALTIIEELKKY